MDRLKLIRLLYFFAIGAIILRLGFWQIVMADDLKARAEKQHFTTKEVQGVRGKILFNDGSFLASTQPTFLVFAQPKVVEKSGTSKKTIAKKLAEIFWELEKDLVTDDEKPATESAKPETEGEEKSPQELIEDEILSKLNQNLYWVSLGRKVDVEVKEKIEALKLKGIGFDVNSGRFYPEGSSSAHLLGFVGSDAHGSDTGYFGLEGFYNGELKGKKGILTEEKDALGLPILIGKFVSKEPKEGKTLKLSIDRSIQQIAEEKLLNGVQKYGAKGGSVVIMEPKSGNIIAMASIPSYDPGNPIYFPKENFKNPVTVDGYEPGSTFKVLVMAAGINEGLIKPDSKCDICEGPLEIGQYSIKTWNNKYLKDQDMNYTLIHSDNVGMVYIGRKLGVEKLYDYIVKFGFGETTGIDLQDEGSPELRAKNKWSEIDLATASFGQGISVTALQVVRAVATIANGGKLMEPHVVTDIRDEKGEFNIKPKVISQPISAETARTVTDMMVKAVEEGESKVFKPKGYKVAGKTGTAQIAVAGHYDKDKTIASFVGFAPAYDPKFVMLVRYDRPSSSIYGAETAAPTFFEIAKEIFTYYGIPPSE